MNLVTAIQAKSGKKRDKPLVDTYANIILRPQPRRGSKFGPIKLTAEEADWIYKWLGSAAKWKWVVGSNHTKFIYNQGEDLIVKITSVSGFYSGAEKNQFNVLEYHGKWIRVETLKAGTDWYKNPIPPYLLQNVYSFKGALPKCGEVILPILTITGSAWIEIDQTTG